MGDAKWRTTTSAEAGFAPGLEENFEIARQAGVLPNLHGIVAARRGQIFFENISLAPILGENHSE